MRKLLCLLMVWTLGGMATCAGASRINNADGTPTQAERYSNGETPTPPQPLPAKYRDYQVLPGSLSPDKRYALIYPRRSRVNELPDCGVFLVAFYPFRVVCQLPQGDHNLCLNARSGYSCQWAANSSVVVMVVDSRWGADLVSAISLHAGRVLHRVELTKEVRRVVRPSYVLSKAAPYNQYVDFVFTDDYSADWQYKSIPPERAWNPDSAGRVRIDCVCASNPKLPDEHDWEVHFTGTWDLRRGRFVEQSFARIAGTSLAE